MPQFTVNGIGWNYTLSGNNATIGDGSASGATSFGNNLGSGGVTPSIPSVLNGYPVTRIGQYAFMRCPNLTQLTIPDSVTAIDYAVFYESWNLTSIKIIGKSLTSIQSEAFLYTSANLIITTTSQTIGGVTYGSPTTGYTISFFGNPALKLALPPPPTMTITSTTAGVTSGSATNNASIDLRFTSSQTTNNFVVGDITVTNGTLSPLAGSGTVYTTTFTPVAPDPGLGQVACTINVAANKYTDVDNQNNIAATTFNWTFDNSSPTMTITSSSGVISGSVTNNATIALTFTSTEATSNFVVGDISVTNGTLSPLTGSGTVYNATFTPTGQGACTIGVAAGAYTDAAGNNNTASNTFNWTFDSVSPRMTITSTTTGVISGSRTKNEFIELTFTSTEATNNFVKESITVTNGALSNFAGSGAIYTATFTPANEGACTIGVLQGAYTDAAANINNLATQFNWIFSTAWSVDASANHIIKSYVKDFIDVSGSVILRENSNLYISGNAETAGNVSLNRLFVTADASFNRRIFVGGDVSMNGSLFINGDLSMNGSVTKCNLNNNSISKSAFASAVPDGPDYNTSRIVYGQTFQANDDVSMNGLIVAANNVTVSGNIIFGDGTVMNAYDNNISTTNAPAFKPSTFTALDICGNLVAGSYATSSDYRIKTNIVELDETYTVDNLRPVKYYQTLINREKYGLIAHELQEHYPDLVIGEKDGTELQRVNYTGLIAILINDIKRLKRELEVLELKHAQ